MTDYKIVIPARLQSTRLPEKPLADINGRPMILHTMDRARQVTDDARIYVATDSEKIAEVVRQDGGNVVITSDSCLTGTDRVAEFAEQIAADTYINLQGDEPMMSPADIEQAITAAKGAPTEIINGWAPILKEEDFRSRSIPKVVIRYDGRLLYMSRSPIPGTKSDEFVWSRKQVCVYAFPYWALRAYAARGNKAAHEKLEDIEILRFLEMGYEVRMVPMSGAGRAVDTPEDLAFVRAAMSMEAA